MRGEQAERRKKIPRGVTKITALLAEKHNFSGEKKKRENFCKGTEVRSRIPWNIRVKHF